MTDLDLSMIDEFFHEDVRKAWEEKDVAGILFTMDNMKAPFFVAENSNAFKEAGILESAVLSSWESMRLNSRRTGDLFMFLFHDCDREKLLACGDPLPGPGPFTLYRGCSGYGRARKIRGFSWTSNFDTAKWFAKRFFLNDPAVYQINAHKDWIIAYTNGRQEQEFIIRVPGDAKIRRVWRDHATK